MTDAGFGSTTEREDAENIFGFRRCLKGLKPWLSHQRECGAVKDEGLPYRTDTSLRWRDGDEATCTCGLAEALGLKEGGR